MRVRGGHFVDMEKNCHFFLLAGSFFVLFLLDLLPRRSQHRRRNPHGHCYRWSTQRFSSYFPHCRLLRIVIFFSGMCPTITIKQSSLDPFPPKHSSLKNDSCFSVLIRQTVANFPGRFFCGTARGKENNWK